MTMRVYSLHDEINFGNKHRGKSLIQVIDLDPDWIRWALDTITWYDISNEAEEMLDDA